MYRCRGRRIIKYLVCSQPCSRLNYPWMGFAGFSMINNEFKIDFEETFVKNVKRCWRKSFWALEKNWIQQENLKFRMLKSWYYDILININDYIYQHQKSENKFRQPGSENSPQWYADLHQSPQRVVCANSWLIIQALYVASKQNNSNNLSIHAPSSPESCYAPARRLQKPQEPFWRRKKFTKLIACVENDISEKLIRQFQISL